jgi:hypothetical protein
VILVHDILNNVRPETPVARFNWHEKNAKLLKINIKYKFKLN